MQKPKGQRILFFMEFLTHAPVTTNDLFAEPFLGSNPTCSICVYLPIWGEDIMDLYEVRLCKLKGVAWSSG